MPYSVILSPSAERTLADAPPSIQLALADRLLSLEKDAASSSFASYAPYPLGYRMVHVDCFWDEVDYTYAILFRYTQDEMGIYVFLIGHRRLTNEA